ncbi:MAG TPA: hypothetical protein VMH81_27590 [Bryobacteraceae bacterium]|nr:hypothetical protein [Bryobacteraceae bacterium]
MTVDELAQEFGVTREQVHAVLAFAAQSAEAATNWKMAISLTRPRSPGSTCW